MTNPASATSTALSIPCPQDIHFGTQRHSGRQILLALARDHSTELGRLRRVINGDASGSVHLTRRTGATVAGGGVGDHKVLQFVDHVFLFFQFLQTERGDI